MLGKEPCRNVGRLLTRAVKFLTLLCSQDSIDVLLQARIRNNKSFQDARLFAGEFSNATVTGLLSVCRDHNLFLMFQKPLNEGLYFPLLLCDTGLNDDNL